MESFPPSRLICPVGTRVWESQHLGGGAPGCRPLALLPLGVQRKYLWKFLRLPRCKNQGSSKNHTNRNRKRKGDDNSTQHQIKALALLRVSHSLRKTRESVKGWKQRKSEVYKCFLLGKVRYCGVGKEIEKIQRVLAME